MPLGFKWTIKSAVPKAGMDECDPKTPCNPVAVNALAATTIAMTIGTRARPISLVIALLSSGPWDVDHGVGGETGSAPRWPARGGRPAPSQSVHRSRHPRRLEIGELTARAVRLWRCRRDEDAAESAHQGCAQPPGAGRRDWSVLP